MKPMDVSVCMTARTATLYWEKPEDAGPATRYTLLLDGRPAAQTARTHAMLTGLAPAQAYTVTLLRDGAPAAEIRLHTPAARRRLDVTAAPYFAKGDGETLNTAALQRALDDCGPGEEVYIPAGVYRTGALDLHSDLAIYLAAGAVLQGSEDPDDYTPRIPSRFEGIEQRCYRSLLNAGTLDHTAGPNCRNILLYGAGTVCGGGRPLAERMIARETAALRDYLDANPGLVASCETDRTIPGRVRGRLINLSNCEAVRITGLTLQNGPSWNLHMIYCRGILTDHCTFRSEGIWNGDGWDPDSSEDCTLFGCRFATGDDSVAIKSGKNPEGNAIARPTRRIRVFDCVSECGNGICIGSEMSGGVEDVRIWDCEIANSSYGIEIKGTPKRGGYVRGVRVRDCRLSRLLVHAVAYNDDGDPAPQPPVFADLSFENLQLTGRRLADGRWEPVPPVEIAGFPAPGHAVQNLRIRNCALPAAAELRLSHCEGVSLENLRCLPAPD